MLLSEKAGCEVKAVSLRYSNRIEAGALGGEPARLLRPALEVFLAGGKDRRAVLLPLFFGPGKALSGEAAACAAELGRQFPEASLVVANCLVDPAESDTRIAEALADGVRKTIRGKKLIRPGVVLVDHGSPERAVTAVRDHLGRQLERLLGDEAAPVTVASMERRPGERHAFNEPLLENLLRRRNFWREDVVVALQFLSPGRHAGPDGDIARICAEACREGTGLRMHLTEPLANDPQVVSVLADRYFRALGRPDQASFLGSIKPTSSA